MDGVDLLQTVKPASSRGRRVARIKVRDRLVKASPGIMNWGEVFIQVKRVKIKLAMIKSIPLSDFIKKFPIYI